MHISKEIMQGEVKNLKPIRYGPFKMLKQVGYNAFQLDLPSYMQMYSVVNVENLRLYEPPLIADIESDIQLPSIEDFSLEFLDELKEDAILDRRTHTSRRGNVDYVRVGLKGNKPSKGKWIEVEKVRDLYTHILNN